MTFVLIIGFVVTISYLVAILEGVKKGNKDQQEIKTRLTWLKEGINKLQYKFKVKG